MGRPPRRVLTWKQMVQAYVEARRDVEAIRSLLRRGTAAADRTDLLLARMDAVIDKTDGAGRG